MDILIKPLSPQLIDNFLLFFDNIVFSENPDWSICYCYSYHFTGTKKQWNKKSNRSSAIKLIKENKMRGYLAYDGSTPIGWCNANDRINYQGITEQNNSDCKICSIVCFLINPDYRRKGIAEKILEQICTDYALKRYDYIEAYPKKGKHSCEGHYNGPLSLYEKFDFKIDKELDNHYIIRKN